MLGTESGQERLVSEIQASAEQVRWQVIYKCSPNESMGFGAIKLPVYPCARHLASLSLHYIPKNVLIISSFQGCWEASAVL